MFYFNNTPIAPSEVDLSQLLHIQNFKKELGELGGLYWYYADLDEFESLLRLHLSRQVQEWVKILSDSYKKPKTNSIPEIRQKNQINDEEGLLDLIENVQENFENGNNTIMKIGTVIQNLGFKVEQRAPEITRLQNSNADITTIRRAYDRVADDLNEFVDIMEKEVPKFSYSYSNAIESLAKIPNVLTDFTSENENELQKLLDMVKPLKNGIETGLNSIIEFERPIKNFPRVSSKFNHSKKRTLTVLANFRGELKKALTMTLEVEKTLEKTISEYKINNETD